MSYEEEGCLSALVGWSKWLARYDYKNGKFTIEFNPALIHNKDLRVLAKGNNDEVISIPSVEAESNYLQMKLKEFIDDMVFLYELERYK